MNRTNILSTAALVTFAAGALASLPPVPAPPQNPITENKRVLGKMLFWDEQLSSDNTMACGTCHTTRGGADVRRQRHPGSDGVLNTPDDAFGSPGVIGADASNNYAPAGVFNLGPQATNRSSMSFIMAAYAPVNFWDGRATGTFVDPQTGQTLIPNGGALESQAVGPPLSSVEMAHAGRDWEQITQKIAHARPLALATNLTSDMAARISNTTRYSDLFAAAFGTPDVTAARIAMAIATYERTLIPDDTPWDRFVAGQTTALTPGQQQGLQAFTNGACNLCHITTNGFFTGNGFRNIGLRPPGEDLGLQLTSGNPADRGKFKVPSLRNVGLRTSFMHNGQFTNLTDVIRFYARAPGAAPQFADNRDPLMNQVNVPAPVAPALQDFLTNGLTDARVANRTFPFDEPTLYSQRPGDRPVLIPGGNTGTGGIAPLIIAADPPAVGNSAFRIGLQNARGGATARVIVSTTAPVNGRLASGTLTDPLTLAGSPGTGGAGFGTLHWPIAADGTLAGERFYFQWIITDPAGLAGEARSNVAQVTLFCGSTGCPSLCPADFNADGLVEPGDLDEFITAFFTMPAPPEADFNNDGFIEPGDLDEFITTFFGGCAS
ncbi:MAG: cytochrome c peroxidase [Phycisphaerales bacterium]